MQAPNMDDQLVADFLRASNQRKADSENNGSKQAPEMDDQLVADFQVNTHKSD